MKVFGLPRGGVPVAYQIARALNVSLDVLLVRKLGLPDNPELAIGAIGAGGVLVLNTELIRWLNISDATIDAIIANESPELRRLEQAFASIAPLSPLSGKTLILVDDGIATASTVRAALMIISRRSPVRIVIATPIASVSAITELQTEVEDVVAYLAPNQFESVDQWYDDFRPVSDESMRNLYERAGASQDSPSL